MNEQEFQLKKYQSESDQDFVARLILELLNLKKASNSHLGAVNQEDKARHDEMVQHSLANLGQGEEAQKILTEIKRVIEEKDIDLSEVVQGLSQVDSSIREGSSGVSETNAILQEIAQSVKENKPNDVVFDSVIEAQKKSTSILGELLSKLAKKEYPKKIGVDGPVEVSKPKWWKEFSFSWEPLKELFEKLKSHTFSVKIENQAQIDPKIFKNLPDDVAKKLSKVLGESLPKIRISGGGGGGNPFTFLEGGALKVSDESGVKDSSDLRINPATKEKQDEIIDEISNKDIMVTLKSLILAIANPSYVDKSANAIRNQVQSGIITTVGSITTLPTLANVTTVAGLTNVDGYQGKLLIINQNIGAWASCVRSRIS